MSSAPRPSADHIRVTWVRLQLISMTQPSQNKLWRSIYCYKLRLYFVTSSRTKLWCFKNILIPCPLIVCSDFFNSKIRIRRSSFWLFQELCEHAEVKKDMSARRQCMLTFGALLRKIHQRPSLQQDTKTKAAREEYTKVMQSWPRCHAITCPSPVNSGLQY